MNEPLSKYRMPAEWEPHRGTWLAWPHEKSDWPGKFAPIPWVYGEIVRTLARFEEVNLIVKDEKQKQAATKVLQAVHANRNNICFHIFDNDRSWLRDSGPIFVRDSKGNKQLLDWRFNAWAKYDNWKRDTRIPAFVGKRRKLKPIQPLFDKHLIVLEGGSIDVNGEGLMLTTEECLLSTVQQRNPPMNRSDYEKVFEHYLGIRKVLWLNKGISGDDTHGHIDDLARFVNPTTIVTVVENDPKDANYEPLQENLDRLKGFTGMNGGKFKIVPLPMPRRIDFKDMRLPASYANFYIANGVVIAPTFNDPADRTALGILAELFPGREVVGIHCLDLVWGLGTLHCMTQQEPV